MLIDKMTFKNKTFMVGIPWVRLSITLISFAASEKPKKGRKASSTVVFKMISIQLLIVRFYVNVNALYNIMFNLLCYSVLLY